MRVVFWGCRGTIASPGADTARYGGNTSCVEVRLDDGTLLILDAGTGLRALGQARIKESPSRIDLLITHLHVDHIEGLGFFEPIWRTETELHVWGPPSPVDSHDQRLAKYFSPPLFPLHLSEVPAHVTFHDAPEGSWTIGGATVHSTAIQHQGITVGYRVEADGAAVTYLTDHEPALGADIETAMPEWISGAALAWKADLLIHDCQYTDEEYEARVGFGHTSAADAAAFAAKVGARRLALFHHDPFHSDDELDAIRERVLERWSVEPSRVVIATEGAELAIER
ncbi:MAG TPA: MBL fold metallo-hydrolase [Actinomycetota bacterium]|nr:MBL fold metallo-hydrolase [Actinomycetota bacterium]